jgi:hypothetical protein
MSLVMLYICSKKEGSVVNLDLEDAISWPFHFMIYMFLEGALVLRKRRMMGAVWEWNGTVGSACAKWELLQAWATER